MDFDAALDKALNRLHDEGRYRTFIDIERQKGHFPHAVWTRPDGTQQQITVWCGNDYLGMGQHPAVLAAMHEALRVFGVDEEDIAEVAGDIRRRDAERLQLQMAGTPVSGVNLMHGQRWQPAPLTQPQREGRALNEEAADAIEERPSAGLP